MAVNSGTYASNPSRFDSSPKWGKLGPGDLPIADLDTDIATQAELNAHAADLTLHSSGRELGYAEITSTFVQNGATVNTIYDVPGLSTTVTVGNRPIFITAFSPIIFHSAAPANVYWWIYEGSTQLAYARNVIQGSGTQGVAFQTFKRIAPSAGSHTYKVSVSSSLAGNLTVTAGTNGPAFIEVVER